MKTQFSEQEIRHIVKALQLTTRALKDIINASDNNEPYTKEELSKCFIPDYNAGYEALQICNVNEIA